MRPFARLWSATGRVYTPATDFLAVARERQRSETQLGDRGREPFKGKVEVKPLTSFTQISLYVGDPQRADMAWAKHPAGGRSDKGKLLNVRDFSEKGRGSGSRVR
jgi:hypothetical protein